jgi:hypothetical protein
MGIKELRKLLNAMEVKSSSWYAFNDKRKTFTRRLKISIGSETLSKSDLAVIGLHMGGVATSGRAPRYAGGFNVLYVHIK